MIYVFLFSMWKLEDICAKPPVGTVGNGNKQMERVRNICCIYVYILYILHIYNINIYIYNV